MPRLFRGDRACIEQFLDVPMIFCYFCSVPGEKMTAAVANIDHSAGEIVIYTCSDKCRRHPEQFIRLLCTCTDPRMCGKNRFFQRICRACYCVPECFPHALDCDPACNLAGRMPAKSVSNGKNQVPANFFCTIRILVCVTEAFLRQTEEMNIVHYFLEDSAGVIGCGRVFSLGTGVDGGDFRIAATLPTCRFR